MDAKERLEAAEQQWANQLEQLKGDVERQSKVADEIKQILSAIDECLRGELASGSEGVVHLAQRNEKDVAAIRKELDALKTKIDTVQSESRRSTALISTLTTLIATFLKDKLS